MDDYTVIYVIYLKAVTQKVPLIFTDSWFLISDNIYILIWILIVFVIELTLPGCSGTNVLLFVNDLILSQLVRQRTAFER